VAAGAVRLGKADPRPARGLKALLVRRPASLASLSPDPEASTFRRFLSTAPEGKTGKGRP